MEFNSLPTKIIFDLDKDFEFLNGINIPILFLTILEYINNHNCSDNIKTFGFLESSLTPEQKEDLDIKVKQYFLLH